jgi:hypothetical protein
LRKAPPANPPTRSSAIRARSLPDKKTAVPVRIHLVFDHIVSVDAENRSIISTVGEN